MTGCLISQGRGQPFVVEMIAADHDALCANAGEFFLMAALLAAFGTPTVGQIFTVQRDGPAC